MPVAHKKNSPSSSTSQSKFPSVGSLFTKSLEILQATWYKQVGLSLLMYVLLFAATVVWAMATVGINANILPSVMEMIQTNSFSIDRIPQSVWTNLSITSIVWFGVLMIISVAFQVMLILVAQYAYQKKNVSMGELWSSGWKKSLPLLGAGLATSFFVLGGIWLLVIPGIVLSVLFSYTQFEVILKNKSVGEALRESMRIVLANFWSLLGRGILLFVIAMVASGIMQSLSHAMVKMEVPFLSMLLNMAYQIGIQSFTIAYIVTLYNQASGAAAGAPKRSLKWAVVVAVIGWALFAFVIKGIATNAAYWINEMSKNAGQEMQQLEEMRFSDDDSSFSSLEKELQIIEEPKK